MNHPWSHQPPLGVPVFYHTDWVARWAWWPIKIAGKYVWLQTVYRRYYVVRQDMDIRQYTEYGTLMDVLKT